MIEIDVHNGASALWFRDRRQTLESYRRVSARSVIGVDVDVAAAERNLGQADHSWSERIHLGISSSTA